MPSITVDPTKTYLDAKGEYVSIERVLTPDDADYHQGFRYVGTNNTKYREDGGVNGQIGLATIIQLGAAPPIQEFEAHASGNVRVVMGLTYANELGQIVMITDTVDPNHRLYQQGYRFIDDVGSYYKPNGICVEKGMFSQLNLVRFIELTAIPDEAMKRIHNNVARNIVWLNRREKLGRAVASTKGFLKRWGVPIGTGIAVGAGVARATAL